jgi:hypothetical protein
VTEVLARIRRPNARTIAIGLVALFTVIGLGLRLWGLEREPLHVDEIVQVTDVQKPLGEIVRLSLEVQQPPLDYLIGKLVVTVAPATDFTQRLPAALFGTATVSLIGLMLIRREQLLAASLAAWFITISPFLVEFSQYARPYALPIFMVSATLAAYQHWHLGNKTWLTSVTFSVLAGLALLSRATMPMVALLAVGLLATAEALKTIPINDPIRLIKSNPPAFIVLPSAVIVVWIPMFFALRASGGRGFLASCCVYDVWDRLAIGVDHAGAFGEQVVQPLSLLLLTIVAAGLVLIPAVRRALGVAAYVWIPLLITAPGFAMVHALTTRPGQFFARRYMVFLPVGLAVFFGIALAAVVVEAWRRRWFIRFGTVALVVVAVAVASVPMLKAVQRQYENRDLADWKSTGEYVESIERPGDLIVTIDTRPFQQEFRFGFVAADRYYEGSLPYVTPNDVIANGSIALDASRYHFVLFVPKMRGGWSVPDAWLSTEFEKMIILTTPYLATPKARIDTWWTVTEQLRPDVAIRTQIAGAAIEAATATALHPWSEVAVAEATELGQEELAAKLLGTATD